MANAVRDLHVKTAGEIATLLGLSDNGSSPAFAGLKLALDQYHALFDRNVRLTTGTVVPKLQAVLGRLDGLRAGLSDQTRQKTLQDLRDAMDSRLRYFNLIATNYEDVDALRRELRRTRTANGKLLVQLTSVKLYERVTQAPTRDAEMAIAQSVKTDEEVQGYRTALINLLIRALPRTGLYADAKQRSSLKAMFMNEKIHALYVWGEHRKDTNQGKGWVRYFYGNDFIRSQLFNNVPDTNEFNPATVPIPKPIHTDHSNKGDYEISLDLGRAAGVDFLSGELYVMDADDNFYTWPTGDLKFSSNTFHSTLLAGKPIQSGGMIHAVDGKITAINNGSGHYLPNWTNLFQAVKVLAERKALHKGSVAVLCFMHGGSVNNAHFPAVDFLSLCNSGFHADTYAEWMDKRDNQYGEEPPIPGDFPVPAGDVFMDIRKKSWTSECYELLGDLLFQDDIPLALNQSSLMTLEEFQRKTNFGVKPRAFTRVAGVDKALKRYWYLHGFAQGRSGPSAAGIRQYLHAALLDLMAEIDTWLKHKSTSSKSKRRTVMELLRRQVLVEEQALRPLLSARADPMAGF